MRSGVRLTGRVEFHGSGARPNPNQLRQLGITLDRAEPVLRTPLVAPRGMVDDTDQFAITGVSPGRYFVRPVETPAWRLESVSIAGRDVTESLLTIGDSDTSDVIVTLTDRAAELRGAVRDARGNPDPNVSICLFPADRSRWSIPSAQTRIFLIMRGSKSGSFVMSNIPPGEYLVAAVADETASAWPDRAFLERLSVFSTSIRIEPSGQHAVALRTGVAR